MNCEVNGYFVDLSMGNFLFLDGTCLFLMGGTVFFFLFYGGNLGRQMNLSCYICENVNS